MAEEDHELTLSAFIKQIARMLREIVPAPLKGKPSKKTPLSTSNKISQIAFLLRSEGKKKKYSKKKKYK